MGGTSSSTRGVFGGGYLSSNATPNTIAEYITIASTGNGIDYGDLTTARQTPGATSNSVRGIWAGGQLADPSPMTNIIDYLAIPTGGTGTDFGDLTTSRGWIGGGSNAHGVLCDGNQGVVYTS